jgi:hypothetical protein
MVKVASSRLTMPRLSRALIVRDTVSRVLCTVSANSARMGTGTNVQFLVTAPPTVQFGMNTAGCGNRRYLNHALGRAIEAPSEQLRNPERDTAIVLHQPNEDVTLKLPSDDLVRRDDFFGWDAPGKKTRFPEKFATAKFFDKDQATINR